VRLEFIRRGGKKTKKHGPRRCILLNRGVKFVTNVPQRGGGACQNLRGKCGNLQKPARKTTHQTPGALGVKEGDRGDLRHIEKLGWGGHPDSSGGQMETKKTQTDRVYNTGAWSTNRRAKALTRMWKHPTKCKGLGVSAQNEEWVKSFVSGFCLLAGGDGNIGNGVRGIFPHYPGSTNIVNNLGGRQALCFGAGPGDGAGQAPTKKKTGNWAGKPWRSSQGQKNVAEKPVTSGAQMKDTCVRPKPKKRGPG